MKNKSLTKLTALVLLLTMIALVIISGTFAKYTSQFDGVGTAIVANWDVTVEDLEGNAYSESTKINLFDATKVYDLKGITGTDVTALNVTDDEDVYNGTDKAIVAPGTWGKVGFVVKVGPTTDVTVKYSVDITKLDTTLPLQFSTNGKDWVTVDDIKTELGKEAKVFSLGTGTVQPRTADSTNTVTLYWKWDFEVGADANSIADNDKIDTGLGKEINKKECIIEAKLVATQED